MTTPRNCAAKMASAEAGADGVRRLGPPSCRRRSASAPVKPRTPEPNAARASDADVACQPALGSVTGTASASGTKGHLTPGSRSRTSRAAMPHQWHRCAACRSLQRAHGHIARRGDRLPARAACVLPTSVQQGTVPTVDRGSPACPPPARWWPPLLRQRSPQPTREVSPDANTRWDGVDLRTHGILLDVRRGARCTIDPYASSLPAGFPLPGWWSRRMRGKIPGAMNFFAP